MTTYSVVLFLHLVSVCVAFGAVALMHLGLTRMRAATQVGTARDGFMLIVRTAPRMPLISLALFLTGAFLTQVSWSWTTSWIDLSIVGLILLQVFGAVGLKPRLGAVGQQIGRAGEGPVADALAVSLRDPVVVTIMWLQPMLAVGVMFVMVTKPGFVAGITELLVAMAVGVAIGSSLGRAAPRTAVPEAKPSPAAQ